MNSDEPVGLDPEVVRDPLDDAGGADRDITDDPTETPSEALVPLPADRGTLVPADPFRRYMAELRRYPRLTRETEQELARRYRETGDRDALFRLITSNLMLVVHVALSFRRAARNLLDLIQEGNVGLLRANERFDPDVGVRLPTYAAWWVRAYMVKFLLDNVRLVRVGTTNARRKLLRNLRREKRRLEERGFEVVLVNSRHVKNVPGRKSDVSDCQWIQELHSVGLLRGSFRPDAEIATLRAYLRHRERLVQDAATRIQRMQKALVEMNLQLHNVISDITGVTGMRILRCPASTTCSPQRQLHFPIGCVFWFVRVLRLNPQ